MARSKFQNYIEYYALKSFMFFLFALHRPLALFFAQITALIIFYIVPIRKKIVIEGLKIAFPEKSIKEIKKTAKSVYQNFASIFVDMFFVSKMSNEKIKQMMEYDNEVLQKALNKNKGLILMSAHYGNWELAALSIAQKYPILLIAANQSNGYVDKLLNQIRTAKGLNVVSRDDKSSFKHIVKALRNNKILVVAGDQDGGYRGVFVPFFGKIASSVKGPAFFALRSGCPIITAFGVRQKDGSLKMKIAEIPIPNSGDEDEDIKTITAIYNQRLEEAIRDYPQQWFWFHRRWKSRPPSKLS